MKPERREVKTLLSAANGAYRCPGEGEIGISAVGSSGEFIEFIW